MVGICGSVLPVWGELFGARVRWGGNASAYIFFGIWHLFVLPVLGTVVLVAANRLGGKYDFVLLLAFELLTLAWMFVPEIIRAGGFFTPFELPIWFVVTVVSIPAIAAFILSGIAYFITKMAARKKNA